jgi:hypothetical protein
MSRLSPDCVWRRILIDTRQPTRARIMALEQIARPSLNLLRRSLSQRTTRFDGAPGTGSIPLNEA